MALHKHGNITSEKAKEILRDGKVRGNPLTSKQKGFFGARAGGNTGHRSDKMSAINRLRKKVS